MFINIWLPYSYGKPGWAQVANAVSAGENLQDTLLHSGKAAITVRVRSLEYHPYPFSPSLSFPHTHLGGEIVTAGAVSYPFPGDRSATLKTLPDRVSVVIALAVSVMNGGVSIFTAGGRPASYPLPPLATL